MVFCAVAWHHVGLQAPCACDPAHASEVGSLHPRPWQPPSVLRPCVHLECHVAVHTIVLHDFAVRDRHEIANGLSPSVRCHPANAAIRRAVSRNLPEQLRRSFAGAEPVFHPSRVKGQRLANLPRQCVHCRAVAHQLHHVCDVTLRRQLRAAGFQVDHLDAFRNVRQRRADLPTVLLPRVAVFGGVRVRQHHHMRAAQQLAVTVRPLARALRLRSGGMSQPRQRVRILFALYDVHCPPIPNGGIDLRQPV